MHLRGWQLILAWVALVAPAVPATAITIKLDYTYDTSGFFPVNSPARTSLEAAASYFSNILTDTFSAITIPDPYESNYPGSNGVVVWNWEQRFQHPSVATSNQVSVANPTVGSNQYVIYAGARSMAGTTAGVGGPGGFFRPAPTVNGSNSFTSSDIDQINNITAAFDDAITTRGESSGFAAWGGTISFDNSNRNWHFDLATTPTSGSVTDFYSVAIHELGHALGFGQDDNNPGTTTPWESWVSGSSFFGDNAYTSYGGAVPVWTEDYSHWAPGTTSVVHGSSTPQEAAMDPALTGGTRKLFTELDAAAMKDIGWSVVSPPGLNGDYNANGRVDAADYVIWRKRLGQNVTIPNDATPGTVRASDYTVWRTNFGRTSLGGSGATLAIAPEPTGAALALLGFFVIGLAQRCRRG